jgi:DNA-directed RNA polymerase specialized sigma24 family protein
MLRGKRERAAILLFHSGFRFAEVAKLLGVTVAEVMHAVRKAVR